MTELTDSELLAELGVAVEVKPVRKHTPREERIIAGFEDILKFYDDNGHAPQHGEDRDIFERLYAVRLDRLRELDECRDILTDLDEHGLLDANAVASLADVAKLDDEALLAKLGAEKNQEPDDITKLRHVQSRDERRAAEEIANRERCEDFDKFEPLFDQVKLDLENGDRTTREFVKDAGFLKADIVTGQFFILGGQIAYVANVGETIKAPNGQFDARLRLIYSNGTESNLLRRSLQRALYKDEAGRRITEATAGPLFGSNADDGDMESGVIYVLRSNSKREEIASKRDLIHKIGVTGGKVKNRVANAQNDPTYLLADVEIVAEYKLFNISRSKLEKVIHRFFANAQFDITINDRFGKAVRPREWFAVPLDVINEAVEKIQDGTLSEYTYDPQTASLRRLT